MTTLQDRPRTRTTPPSPSSHRRLIMGFALVVVLALGLTWLIGFSSVFGVGTVEVRGNHRVSDDAVRQAAAIEDGTPLVRLDTGAVRHRVLQLPDIASVSVQESFPSTVVITVEERTAVGYLETSTSGYELVDRSGATYRAASTKPTGLPRLAVPTGATKQTLADVATVAADLPPTLLRRLVSVQAMDPQAITLVLRDGRVVRWGSIAASQAKADILPALLRQPGQQFDLSNPSQPVVR